MEKKKNVTLSLCPIVSLWPPDLWLNRLAGWRWRFAEENLTRGKGELPQLVSLCLWFQGTGLAPRVSQNVQE